MDGVVDVPVVTKSRCVPVKRAEDFDVATDPAHGQDHWCSHRNAASGSNSSSACDSVMATKTVSTA